MKVVYMIIKTVCCVFFPSRNLTMYSSHIQTRDSPKRCKNICCCRFTDIADIKIIFLYQPNIFFTNLLLYAFFINMLLGFKKLRIAFKISTVFYFWNCFGWLFLYDSVNLLEKSMKLYCVSYSMKNYILVEIIIHRDITWRLFFFSTFVIFIKLNWVQLILLWKRSCHNITKYVKVVSYKVCYFI